MTRQQRPVGEGERQRTASPLTVGEALLSGRALGAVDVVDAHAHIGPWFNFRIPHAYADGMLRTMDSSGIAEAWITADAAIGPDFRLGNELVWRAVQEHPDRFRGYVTVNPHEPQASAEELRRRIDQGWRLIKLHPGTHEHPADGAGYQPIWEIAEEHGLHVLSHSFPSDDALIRLARTYPNVTLQVAHAANAPQRLAGLYSACSASPNVYLDLCGSLQWRGCLEEMVKHAGADRVLYGSDIPFLDPRPQLGRVGLAQIGDADKRAVLGENARALWSRWTRLPGA